MYIKLYEKDTSISEVKKIVSIIENNGVAIIPTDSVYAFACSLNSQKAMTRIARIKGIDTKRSQFSIICDSLRDISKYARFDNSIFKLLKRNLPGAFTFILNGSNELPKLFNYKRKTIGIRIPHNQIPIKIVEELGCPLVVTSLKESDEITEYLTDPELIYERYCKLVDVIIDGGYGDNVASTIVDCTEGEHTILRQGNSILVE